MLRNTSLACAFLLLFSSSTLEASSASLRGSRASMIRQNQVAKEEDFTFLRTPGQVDRFVEEGYLVPVEETADYALANVSYPYARPALRTLIERLSAQYRSECGEKLVITSLTRPRSEQPGNSHPLSVHPAGMAVDLRVSDRAKCRQWLEGTLLSLERDGMLDITREYHPPHYHVALFPEPYMAHVGRMLQDSLRAVQAEREAAAAELIAATRAASAWRETDDPVRLASLAPTSRGEPRDDRWLVLGALAVIGGALVRRLRTSLRERNRST